MSEQLTPEALMSRLQAQRLAPPLLLHTSLWDIKVRVRKPGIKRDGGDNKADLLNSLLTF